MTNDPISGIGRLSIDPSRLRLKDLELVNQRRFATDFSSYDPGAIEYVNGNDIGVVTGQAAMEQLVASGRLNGALRVKPIVLVDGAFEGGGAHGLYYLGSLHALAHAGIWFGRVAGTSAGSLAAALIAAGYEIDLNYKPRVVQDAPPSNLAPSANNSLNRILFEDNLGRLSDFQRADDPSINGSWTAEALDQLFENVPFLKQFKNIEDVIMRSVFDVQGIVGQSIENQLNGLGIPAFLRAPIMSVINGALDSLDQAGNSAADTLRKNILRHFLIIQPSLWGETTVRALTQGVGVMGTSRQLLPPHQLVANRALFRLLERGGLWTGNALRDWLEAHLGAKVSRRSGPGGTVAFRDLPLDLCVTAVSIGKPGQAGPPPSHDQTLFFSKKTTPNYSVAEAVRRSTSLPFAFDPLLLEDGNGDVPANVATSPIVNVGGIGRSVGAVSGTWADGAGAGVTPPGGALRLRRTLVDYAQHAGSVLVDGGFRVNLPIGVFRDPKNRFMEDNFAASGEAKRFVVAFNLDGLTQAEPRPDGVPPQQTPTPLREMGKVVGEVGDFFGGLSGPDATLTLPFNVVADLPKPPPLTLPDPREAPGMKRMMLVMKQLLDYATGGSAEQQVVELLAAAEKTIAINIPTRDPHAASGDDRGGSGDFGVPPITRKWWAHTSWNATRKVLNAIGTTQAAGGPPKIGIADAVQPYWHQLDVRLQTPTGQMATVTAASRAAWNEPLFDDMPDLVAMPPLGGRALVLGTYRETGPQDQRAYLGTGMVWLRTRNADRGNGQSNYIDFTTNMPVRVILLFAEGDQLPASLRGQGWQDDGKLVDGVRRNQRTNFRVARREFPAGRILLPGAGSAGSQMTKHNYTVLLLPV